MSGYDCRNSSTPSLIINICKNRHIRGYMSEQGSDHKIRTTTTRGKLPSVVIVVFEFIILTCKQSNIIKHSASINNVSMGPAVLAVL